MHPYPLTITFLIAAAILAAMNSLTADVSSAVLLGVAILHEVYGRLAVAPDEDPETDLA